MKATRRQFAASIGAAAAGGGLWTRAEQELEASGEVSRETVLALLDAQGGRGIYEDPDRLEELRVALTKKLREHQVLRDFPVSMDAQPLLGFER